MNGEQRPGSGLQAEVGDQAVGMVEDSDLKKTPLAEMVDGAPSAINDS